MSIGEKIFTLRQKYGWSQDELAEKLSVSRQSVSKWESGKALPDSDKIVMLSELFSVSTDCLLKDSEELTLEMATDTGSEDTSILPEQEPDCEFNIHRNDGELNPEGEKRDFKAVCKSITQKVFKKKNIPAIVTACVLVIAILLYPLGIYGKALQLITEEPVQYPYILVHGLGGWGAESGINEKAPYWGATTGSLKDYLDSKGYSVYEASVGPFSSTWDRTCELYAQLTGTKVDYGEAHSKANGHARYGRTYKEPLFKGWGSKTKGGQIKKINLIGHSFGGPTVRMLASLLENGAQEEVKASGDTVSPLFKGGKGNWVNSVTGLCSPNNGSTLFLVLDQLKLTSVVLDTCLAFAGIAGNSNINGFLDFHLEQFGISQIPGEKTNLSDMKTAVEKIFKTGNDNAAYDLSPDGAAVMNKKIGLVKGVYYFSYSYCTTIPSAITGNQVPKANTLLVLIPTAYLMGRYSENKTTEFKIDKTWLPNDGLVNVVSAKYPTGDKWKDFNEKDIEKGIWNVMPTKDGDHGTVIGLNADTQLTHNFYTSLFTTVDSQPRDRKYYFKSPF